MTDERRQQLKDDLLGMTQQPDFTPEKVSEWYEGLAPDEQAGFDWIPHLLQAMGNISVDMATVGQWSEAVRPVLEGIEQGIGVLARLQPLPSMPARERRSSGFDGQPEVLADYIRENGLK